MPDAAVSPKGGRTEMYNRWSLRSIFWVLNSGAKWKDLYCECGSDRPVHKHFALGTKAGVVEDIMRDAGELIEERGGYRLYECFIDATSSKARGRGDGGGVTKAGKGAKSMMLFEARGLSVAATTGSASPHESELVQGLSTSCSPFTHLNASSATRRMT